MDVPGQFISRVAARRADFRYALRLGDAVGAARAASRLLVVANALDPATGHRIRDARTRLGHGLRLARKRRAMGPIPAASVVAVPQHATRGRASTRQKWSLLAALGVIAVLLLQLIPAIAPEEGGGGGVAAAPQVITTTLALRGRTSDLVTPSPVAVATEVPSESPAPTSEPNTAPAAVARPAAT